MGLIPVLGFAQLNGIWVVNEVKAGENIVTPQSKWFEFREDNQVLGGNGGVINSRGSYNLEGDQVHILDKDGKDDGYGPFKILSSDNDLMTWSREEEGMEVIISLRAMSEIPEGPWDQIVGFWQVEGADENYLFRWDKFFNVIDPEGNRSWGIWHMHAHKPELRLMHFEEGKEDDLWNYEISEGSVKIIKGGQVLFTLKRGD